MKLKMIEKVFFISWLLCGLSLDCFFESKANMAYTAVMAIIGVASAVAIYRKDKNANIKKSDFGRRVQKTIA